MLYPTNEPETEVNMFYPDGSTVQTTWQPINKAQRQGEVHLHMSVQINSSFG